jgi:hypothetical protein
MYGWWLSRSLDRMHPTVMTMIATDRATDLRSAADERRRNRVAKVPSRRFPSLRIPGRGPRVAHA